MPPPTILNNNDTPKGTALKQHQKRNTTMKTLLITAAIVVMLTPHAQAETMPNDFYGAWCYSDGKKGKGTLPNGFNNETEIYYKTTGHNRTDINCPNNDGHDFLSITPKGWRGTESACDIVRKTVKGTEVSRPVYEIVFKGCSDEGNFFDADWRAYIDREGLLHIRWRVTNQKSAY
jgi:hypothetical protein